MNEIATPSVTKPALQFGILFGVLMVLEFAIGYSMNIDPVSNPAYGTIINVLNYFIFPVLFIAMACNGFKKSNNGFIGFGQCLKIGVLLCVLAGLIYTIFFSIFTMIFPEFIPEMVEKIRTVTLEQKPDISEDELNMTTSMMEKFMKPALLIPVTLAMFAFIGLIYSLIIGAIVKKDKPVSF
jgi:hypothetical protein